MLKAKLFGRGKGRPKQVQREIDPEQLGGKRAGGAWEEERLMQTGERYATEAGKTPFTGYSSGSRRKEKGLESDRRSTQKIEKGQRGEKERADLESKKRDSHDSQSHFLKALKRRSTEGGRRR